MDAQQGPLTETQVSHAIRRLGFGVTLQELEAAAGKTAQQLITGLLDGAKFAPTPPEPAWKNTWGGTGETKDQRIREYRQMWLKEMVTGNQTREKLALFWHGELTTEYRVYGQPTYSLRYLKRLRQMSQGNYKEFVRTMGLEPAMMRYLDGNLNTAGNPNENYARELIELYTMGRLNEHGQPNYTETDIIEIARALTGWQVITSPISSTFYGFIHDAGQKTIFGRTGNWGYDDVVDIIFDERPREIALRVCAKIYREFVYEIENSAVISQLADVFIASNWELRPVFEKLFFSRHFYQDRTIGSRIKTPVEYLVGIVRESGFQIIESGLFGTYRRMYEGTRDLTMDLFNPPDVSGWTGDRAWLSTSLLTKRWEIANRLIEGPFYDELPDQDLVSWAKTVTTDDQSAEATVDGAVRVMFPQSPEPETNDQLVDAFKASIPQDEFDEMRWNLDWMEAEFQMRAFAIAVYQSPEYQLT